MVEEKEYYESGRQPRPIRVTSTINPWNKGTPAYAIIDQIYRATGKGEGLTLEELATSVGWSSKERDRVYYIIEATRYQVNWILASDYVVTGRRPDSIKWVYFRAVNKKDQRRYILRRYMDHVRRGYSVGYLCEISDLMEEEIKELMEEGEKLVEVTIPFVEEEVKV